MMFRTFICVAAVCVLAASVEQVEKVECPNSLNPAAKVEEETPNGLRNHNPEPPKGKYYVEPCDWPENGVPGDSMPSYDERSIGTWMNVARIGFQWFRDTYLCPRIFDGTCTKIFDTCRMQSVAPGFWNHNLNRAARAHCEDVLENPAYYRPGGGHNDANGTDWYTRVSKFSPVSAEIYENFAPGGGINRGSMTVFSWMCDGHHEKGTDFHISFSGCQTDCCASRRDAIMNQGSQFGCGVGADRDVQEDYSNSFVVTCDLLDKKTEKYKDRRIALASHVGDPLQEGKYMYLATVATSGADVKCGRVYEFPKGKSKGIEIPLNILFAGPKGAVYGSESFNELTECRSYYFEIDYDNVTERYPESGYFSTYGMNCNSNWKEILGDDPSIAVIVGSVVGAFVLAGALAATTALLVRRRRNRNANPAADAESGEARGGRLP